MNELGQLREYRAGAVASADREPARRALAEAIAAERHPPERGGLRGLRAPLAGRRTMLLGAAATLAALAVAVALLPSDRGGPNEAVAALQKVAAVAGNQPAESPPETGQYLYSKAVTQAGPEVVVLPGSRALLDASGNAAPVPLSRGTDPLPPPPGTAPPLRPGTAPPPPRPGIDAPLPPPPPPLRPGIALDPFEDPNIIYDKEAARAGVPKYTTQFWDAPGGDFGRRVVVLDGVFGFPGVPIDEQARREKWDFRCDRPLGCWPGGGSGVAASTDRGSSTEIEAGGLGPSEFSLGPTQIYRDLSGLPTDPDELREEIEAGGVRDLIFPNVHQGGRVVETFDIVGQLLSTPGSFAPPEVRRALYEVVAQLPDVELVGEVTDPVGRPGVAVALTNNGIQRHLIFDPDNAALLAKKDVAADPDAVETEFPQYELEAEPGTLISYTAYLTAGVVDSPHQTLDPNRLQGAELPSR